jgi:hypothetical protein
MYEKHWIGSSIPDIDRLMLFHLEVEDLVQRGKHGEARRLFEAVTASHAQHGYDPVEFLELVFLSGEQLRRERAQLAEITGEANV